MAQTMQDLKTRLARLYNKKSSALSQLNMVMSHVSRLTVFAFLAVLIGCAGPQQETKQRRYFWPPLPDTPKIEWIGAYSSQNDFPKTGMEAFSDFFIGSEPRGFKKPWGITSDNKGQVYVTDTQIGSVIVYDFNKKTVSDLLKEEGGKLFENPAGIALDDAGNIYVSDSKKGRVFAFTKYGNPLLSIGDENVLGWPTGLVIDDKRKRLYVVNAHKHNVATFDLSGKYLFSIGKRGDRDGYFNYPSDIDIDSQGNLVVADAMNARVQIFTPEGQFIKKFGHRGDNITDFQLIKGIAVDKNDNIYVVDGRANKFLIFNQQGEPLLVIGGVASVMISGKVAPGGFLLPQDIFIDKNNNTIYIVDSLNTRFQIFQIIDEGWLKQRPIE